MASVGVIGAGVIRVGVIGAGVSGMAAAKALAAAGREVVLFDKGRGPGGRLATRRAEAFAFDHGAQYFTVKDKRFEQALSPDAGAEPVTALWSGRFGTLRADGFTPQPPLNARLVALPGMSGLARHLAQGLTIALSARIQRATREDGGWRLIDETGVDRGLYDSLIVAVPPDQAVPLLKEAPDLAASAAAAVMDPCWAALLGFAEPPDLPFDGAGVEGSPLAWIARNDAKPGRKPGPALVLHASPDWSRAHLELKPEEALPLLTQALTDVLGRHPGAPIFAAAHRWRYAQVASPAPGGPRFDKDLGVGICGDWTVGPRVESAWLSGRTLAARMLAG